MLEYGCIGEKLAHSFSKEIHSLLASYSYELCEIPKEDLDAFMRKKKFRAINVTIPYKQDVIPFLDYIDPVAQKIGAVNTIVNREGKLYGYNTDFEGMSALIKRANINLYNKKVLIAGSGGTSKTAYAVAKALGAKEVFRISRTNTKDCITYEDVKKHHLDAEIIINTTPCGMYPNMTGCALEPNDFKKLEGAIDAVYNPLRSEFIQKAENLGVPAVGGLYMLVAQAAAAVGYFTNTEIPQEKIEEVYKKILYSKRNLVLVGMPSSGKTTLGKELCRMLGMEFIDTDEEIVARTKKSIPQIFEECGEKGFRDIEETVIKSIADKNNAVIATGGGAILRECNITALKANGVICFLDRPLEKLITTADRPLSNTDESLKKRYRERYGIYSSCADFRVDCSGDIKTNLNSAKRGFLE